MQVYCCLEKKTFSQHIYIAHYHLDRNIAEIEKENEKVSVVLNLR